MTFKPFAIAGAAVVGLACLAPVAMAQQAARPAAAAAPAAAPQMTHGAPVPGLCTFVGEDVILLTNVGRGVFQKIDGEFATERTALQTEGQQYQNSTPPQAFQDKVRAFQQKVQQRQQNLKPDEQQALARVGAALEPTVREVYQQRKCSILLSRTVVMATSPSHDITPAVIASLNAKVPK